VISRVFIAIIVLLTSVNAASVTKIVKELQDKYEKITNLSAEFVQIDKFKLTGSQTETTGKIFIKDGVKYRLETEDQIIVTDGQTVWTYSIFNNQVLVDRVKEGDGSLLPRDLLFRYPRDYFASLLDEVELDGEDYYILRLDPKEGVHGFIKTMKIWVNSDSYMISKIEYTDFNDNISYFEIKQVDIDTKLNDSLFQLEIGEGVNVIDLRM
jgi:chaperone LolA